MPHLWMFLLQSLTPPGHEVILIDGNAQPMDETALARYVKEKQIGLVGIGAMTRMVAKAYRMADAVRATGVPVVMGGPHVTEEADESGFWLEMLADAENRSSGIIEGIVARVERLTAIFTATQHSVRKRGVEK